MGCLENNLEKIDCSVMRFDYTGMNWYNYEPQLPLLVTWFNFNPSMDK